MKTILIPLLLFGFALFAVPLAAQNKVPPPAGYVWNVDWIYIPGIANAGGYTIQWGGASGADWYELEEDTNSGFSSPTLLCLGPMQSFTVGSRVNGTYYYRVRGINTFYQTSGSWLSGDHPHTVDGSVATIPTAPSAPSSISAPSFSPSGLVAISWGTVSGAAAYDVQGSSRIGGSGPVPSPNWFSPFAVIGSDIAQPPYNFTSPNYREWRFRVRSTVNVGSYKLYSLWSSSTASCVVDIQPIGSPTWITVPSTSQSGAYTINWGAALNAASYDLEEDSSSAFPNPSVVYQGISTSFMVTGNPSGTYYYRVRAVNPLSQSGYIQGANPCTVTRVGTLNLSAGAQNVSQAVAPGTPDAPVLQIDLSADAVENVHVHAVTVTNTGTLNLASDLSAAHLILDGNGNGQREPGESCIATVSAFVGNAFSFTGLNEIVNASTTETWLVTYDVSATAPLQTTIRASVMQNTDLFVSGSSSVPPQVTGAPVTGATQIVNQVGSLAIVPCPGNATEVNVLPGAEKTAVLQLKLVVGSVEAVTVTGFTVTGMGSGQEVSEIARAFFYFDANGNDSFDANEDSLVAGPVNFTSDNGTIAFPFAFTLPANAAQSFFVVYDFAPSAAAGSTFRAGFVHDTEITVTGVASGQPPMVSGAPLWGGKVTVTAPAPPAPSRDGSCGGGTTPSGPCALLAWVVFLGLLVTAVRGVRKGKSDSF
ncbi:MAG: phage tail protein [Planctomycetota bacterium]|jgi:hypothetical protein